MIAFRQFGRQREGLSSTHFALILFPLFGGEDPLEFPTAGYRQRHFLAVCENLHRRQRVNRHFRGGCCTMHRIQQTLFSRRSNRLRLTVRIDVVGTYSRRQRGVIKAFSLHRPVLSVLPARYVVDSRELSGRS